MTFCDLFLVMWVTFDNIKHLAIIPKKKENSTFYMSPTPCVVSLSFLFSDTLYSGNINSWRSYYGNIFLLAWYVSCACELFSVNLIVFAMKSCHEQLYVKIINASRSCYLRNNSMFDLSKAKWMFWQKRCRRVDLLHLQLNFLRH